MCATWRPVGLVLLSTTMGWAGTGGGLVSWLAGQHHSLGGTGTLSSLPILSNVVMTACFSWIGLDHAKLCHVARKKGFTSLAQHVFEKSLGFLIRIWICTSMSPVSGSV